MNISKVLICVLGAVVTGVITRVLLANGSPAKGAQHAAHTADETAGGSGPQTNEATETAYRRAEFNQANSQGLSGLS